MTTHALDGFLCCLAGPDQFALRGTDVSLVARAEEMRAQDGEDGRVGVLARGGHEIPVYGLAQLLGGTRDTRVADRHVVLTGRADARYGLLVDRVVRASGAEAVVIPIPRVIGGAAARWFGGLLTLQETSCLVLAPEGLRPGSPASAHGAASTPAPGTRPAEEIRSLVLTFSSASLPEMAGAQQVAVSAARVSAVVQSLPLVTLPGGDPHIAGLAAWRRSAIAVIDFSPGRSVTAVAHRFVVMRCSDGSLVAIAVDADTTLRRATVADARAGIDAPDFVRGIFQVGSQLVALLDVDRLATGAAATSAATRRGVLVPALV